MLDYTVTHALLQSLLSCAPTCSMRADIRCHRAAAPAQDMQFSGAEQSTKPGTTVHVVRVGSDLPLLVQ